MDFPFDNRREFPTNNGMVLAKLESCKRLFSFNVDLGNFLYYEHVGAILWGWLGCQCYFSSFSFFGL